MPIASRRRSRDAPGPGPARPPTLFPALRSTPGIDGYLGLFLCAAVLDMLVQPVFPDIFLVSYILGGADFFASVVVCAAGSATGGSLGYLFGYLFGTKGFKKWFGKRHLSKGKKLFEKYGVLAVVVAALSPFPYSAISWMAGIYDMKYSTFLITSLCSRFGRFLFFAFLASFA